jgi:hypothetical protein
MVSRGADTLSVVTGFPILSRYIYEREYDAVRKIVELTGFRSKILFVCDKSLKLPLDYVREQGSALGNFEFLYTYIYFIYFYLCMNTNIYIYYCQIWKGSSQLLHTVI